MADGDFGFLPAESMNQSCIPPLIMHGSPAVHLLLVGVAVVSLVIWIWGDPVPWEELLGGGSAGALPVLFDAPQVMGAVAAMAASLDAKVSAALASDFEWSAAPGRYRLPPVAELQPGKARFIVPNSIVRFQRWLRRFRPGVARLDMLRRAFEKAATDPRFLMVHDFILHTVPKASPDPCSLTMEGIKDWVCKFKVTTKFLCLIRHQLDELKWQLCQQLKEEYIAGVARPYINSLLEVARSFSRAGWTVGHIVHMLLIFGTLADALDNICDIYSTISVSILDEVGDIFGQMVGAFKMILDETANDIHRRKESAIQPASSFLIQALACFHHNGCMVPLILSPRDYTIDLHECWVLKLERDAKSNFEYEVERRYIFILNNTCFVWQKYRGLLSSEQRVYSLIKEDIEQHIRCYLDKSWQPLLDDSSLDGCTADFERNCNIQRKWKVRTELKPVLRERIVNLIVPDCGCFNKQPTKCFLKSCRNAFQRHTKTYTVEQLEKRWKKEIRALFER